MRRGYAVIDRDDADRQADGSAGLHVQSVADLSPQQKQIIFAHCTPPLTMPSAFRLMTHFESDLGVALAGHLREGDATVFKRSALMDRYFVQDGEIVENLNEKHLCRTQIRVSLPQGYLLREPIGNHHLIVLGHYASRVQEFFRFH